MAMPARKPSVTNEPEAREMLARWLRVVFRAV
jgi:hypothetical protein